VDHAPAGATRTLRVHGPALPAILQEDMRSFDQVKLATPTDETVLALKNARLYEFTHATRTLWGLYQAYRLEQKAA
jgi:hypothetical protein